MVKKLWYLLFILPFILPLNVFANSYQLTFNSFYGGGSSYSIQSNNNQSIVYNVPFSGSTTNYEWTTTNSPTCSSTAVVSGILYIDNTSFGVNNDDVAWGRVYIRSDSNSGATNCSIQVADNGTRYVCTSSNLSSNFIIGYTLNSNTPPVSLNHVITRNVDINCDTSTGQIIDNQNANTQNIINNNSGNTQNIINNQNSNTNAIIGSVAGSSQDIINNQNQNTQQEIESQKVCSDFTIDKSSVITNGKIILSNGSVGDNNLFGVTDYIDISHSTDIVNIKPITYSDTNTNAYFCTYDASKVVVNCYSHPNYSNRTISVSSNEKYARFSILLASDIPQFSITFCKNGNQALNDSVNGLNDTLNNDTPPDTENQISDLESGLASDTPITDLLTLPINLLTSYVNGISSTCSPYNLGNLLGTNLVLPCLNLEQRLGSNLWTTIDSLFSIFMIYNIAMLMITAFEGFTSLRDDYEALYQPRHADTGYQPKHGGGN